MTYLNSHLHLGLLEREVQAGDAGVLDHARHLLRRDGAVERVPVHQHRLARALAVRLQHVHRLDGVEELLLALLLVVGKPHLEKHQHRTHELGILLQV